MSEEEIKFIKTHVLPRTNQVIVQSLKGDITNEDAATQMNAIFDEERARFNAQRDAEMNQSQIQSTNSDSSSGSSSGTSGG